APECPMASKCLFTAIDKEMKVLSKSSNDKAKLAALKFLGHWIGDLHQPLHVSFEDDRGGGKIRESGPCTVNLHSVWDGCIIEHKLAPSTEPWRGTWRRPSHPTIGLRGRLRTSRCGPTSPLTSPVVRRGYCVSQGL